MSRNGSHDVKIRPFTATICVVVELVMGYVYIRYNHGTVKSPLVPMMITIPLVGYAPLLKRAHWIYTVWYVAMGLFIAYMFSTSDYKHFFLGL